MGKGRSCRICCCCTFQSAVAFFAIINIALTGFQLLMPLIPSGFMVYFQVTRQKFQARYVLKEETLSIFQRVPNIYLQPFINTSKVSIQDLERTSSSLQSDLHVWASWIFMRSAVFVYSFVLLWGARQKNYNLCLAWFAMTLPLTGHNLLMLIMDIVSGLMFRKPLKMQIFDGVYVAYLIFGLIFVYAFLRRIHFMRGVRYPDFKRETEAKFRDTSNLNL